MLLAGCIAKSKIEGVWEVTWDRGVVPETNLYRSGVESFNWIYYMTGKDNLGDSGNIFIEGINFGDYKIEDGKISLDINNNYTKLFGLEVGEYIGEVIGDQYMEGEVSFKYEGKTYTVNWNAEKL